MTSQFTFDLGYLATPYAKFPGGIDAAFREAACLAAKLLRAGYVVYAPIVHTHPVAVHGGIDPLDHSIWIAFDEAMMGACDALLVATLPTWNESRGIRIEIAHFERAGKPVYLLDPDSLRLVRHFDACLGADVYGA